MPGDRGPLTGSRPLAAARALALAALLWLVWPTPTALAAPHRPATTAGSDHSCVVGRAAAVPVHWSTLSNPLLTEPDAAVKDEAVAWVGGRWHLLASYLTATSAASSGGAAWHIASFTSPDLRHWSTPSVWPTQVGTLGVASPDIVQDPHGTFVVTYQSDPGEKGGGADQLYYRTSRDLTHFSRPRPLAHGLATRMIDGALVYTRHGLVLGYKAGVAGQTQQFRLARSSSGSLDGPWHRLGAPAIHVVGGTIENEEFVDAGGKWRLVATSNNLDQPWIFTLEGDPATGAGWLHWDQGRELAVPGQAWDHGPGVSSLGFEQDNSAYLCVDGATDLLFYAGSPDLTSFGGWGHASIGVARSTDLLHWSPAGAPAEGD